MTNVLDSNTTSIVSYQYDAAGQRTSRTLANNTATTYQYDAAGRLTNVVHTSHGTNLSSYAYGYDSVGNRTWVKRLSGRGDVYTYDLVDQVTNVVYDAKNPDSSPSSWTNQMSYAIDATDNWTNRTQVVPGISTTTTTYLVNGLNQYTSINGTTQSYDAKGNYYTDGTSSYFYDSENRLICAVVASLGYTNAYDVFGRFIARKLSSWRRFYYAGWQLIEERNPLGNPTAKYVYGPGLL